MEGIADLCDDLDLDPTVDIRVLVLFFKLGANAKPGEISQAEWNRGCEELGLEKVEDFKKLLPSLDTGFMDHKDFRKFYKVRRFKITSQSLVTISRHNLSSQSLVTIARPPFLFISRGGQL